MINFSFSGYAIASSIILMFCGMAYKLAFSSKVKPSICRIVILCIFAVSLMLPLSFGLFSLPSEKDSLNIVIGSPTITNVQVLTNASGISDNITEKFLSTIRWIYSCGFLFMAIITILSLIKLFILKHKAKKVTVLGVKVYLHDNHRLSSFSWLNDVFLYEKAAETDSDILLRHELAHIRLRHWIDLIFTQVILIFQWFNPMCWYLRKEIQQIHEFQADGSVIKSGVDEGIYQRLLIRNVSKVLSPSLVAGINNCSLKKRLMIMRVSDFNSNWLSRSVAVAILAICGCLFINTPSLSSVLYKGNRDIIKKNSVILSKDSSREITYLINNQVVNYDEISKINPNIIDNIEVFKGETPIINIMIKNDVQTSVLHHQQKRDKIDDYEYVGIGGLVYKESQQILPTYEGGETKLKKDIRNNLLNKYVGSFPKGNVIVRFTVTSNGEVKKFKILESMNSKIDISVINAIKNLPGKWIPGRQNDKPVDIELEIPIDFGYIS